jgi:F-box/TPR repeat protein Pof3
MKINKHEHALKVVNQALQKLGTQDSKHRSDLETLRTSITAHLQNDKLSQESRHQFEISTSKARRKFRSEEGEVRRVSTKPYYFGILPVELAVVIFDLIVEDNYASVIALGQICQDWRRIVVTTPTLWTTLSLSRVKPAQKAKLWKARSQGTLKDLRVSSHDEALWALSVFADVPMHSLHSLTIDQRKRKEIISYLPQLTATVISNLETLLINDIAPSCNDRWFQDTTKCRLRRLCATGVSIDWLHLAECSGCLAELSISTIPSEEVRPILWLLHHNTGLESLSLNFMFADREDEQTEVFPQLPPRVELPLLTRLTLSDADLSPYDILGYLQLPNLRSLKLTKLRLREGRQNFLMWILESPYLAKLENLELISCVLPDPQRLVDVLSAAIELRSIQLDAMSGIDQAIELLGDSSSINAQDSTHVVCPKLTAVNFSRSANVRNGPIISLVRARTPSSKHVAENHKTKADESPKFAMLQSLVIDGCDQISADILPWLRQQVPRVSCTFATKKQASWRR